MARTAVSAENFRREDTKYPPMWVLLRKRSVCCFPARRSLCLCQRLRRSLSLNLGTVRPSRSPGPCRTCRCPSLRRWRATTGRQSPGWIRRPTRPQGLRRPCPQPRPEPSSAAWPPAAPQNRIPPAPPPQPPPRSSPFWEPPASPPASPQASPPSVLTHLGRRHLQRRGALPLRLLRRRGLHGGASAVPHVGDHGHSTRRCQHLGDAALVASLRGGLRGALRRGLLSGALRRGPGSAERPV